MIEFTEPIEMESVLINGINIEDGVEPNHGTGPLYLEVSDDGNSFRSIATIGRISSNSTGMANISPLRVRYFRIRTPAEIRLDEIIFYASSKRLNDWMIKTNHSQRPTGTRMTETAPQAGQPVRPEKEPVSPIELPAGLVIDPDTVWDLTDRMTADGELVWSVPEGSWTVLRMGHTATGSTNRAAPDNGQGLECDKFSKEAFDQHFYGMFDRILPILESLAGKGRAAVEIDSYEVGMQNWTRNFPHLFKKNRGYSLVKYMPVFTGRIIGSTRETENFLWDARRVMADLMADNYYGRCAELCRKHGLLFYGEPYKMGPMEGMQAGARMDHVMGEFWARGQRNKHTVKMAASIQHLNGKKIVAAESYTGHSVYSKWQQYPFAMKAQGDYMFTKGLTRMIFHTSPHQPHPSAKPGMTMGPFGTQLDRNVTWFSQAKPWMDYISRCQFLLQQGLFVADILYYTGEEAPGEEIALKEQPLPEPPFGYDFDYINTEILLNKVSVKDGRIVLPDQMSYKVLILPQNKTMSLRVLLKLRELLAQGVKLAGNLPNGLSGLSNLNGTGDDGSYHPVLEEVRPAVLPIVSVQALMDKLGIPADFNYSSLSPDAVINYIHRSTSEAEVYFVCNRKRRFENLVCTFRAQGVPELWDADTGTITPVSIYNHDEGLTVMPLHLHASGSVFVVFKKDGTRSLHFKALKRGGRMLINTSLLPAPPAGKYKDLYSNFSQCVWIKPESDIAVAGMNVMRREDLCSFVFSPFQGELLYGKGHAVCGLAAGRNGVVVYERETNMLHPVYEILKPIEGWTHLALVYENGKPSVYLNGTLAGTGPVSAHIVHPSAEEEHQDVYSVFFEGDMDKVQLFDHALPSSEIRQLSDLMPELNNFYPEVEIGTLGNSDLLVWTNGDYELQDAQNRITRLKVKGLLPPIELKGSWQLSFPEGLGAPLEVTELPELISLHKHPLDGIRYFSGTSTYQKEFTMEQIGHNQRLFLDLGRVEILAEVEVNGKNLGVLWKRPFRVDVTDAIRTGSNMLKVKVTNLWPNRLIGDEQYPEENEYSDKIFEGQKGGYGIQSIPDWFSKGEPKPASRRLTFSTWKHYQKEDPLLESGLIGPVKIYTGQFLSQVKD